MKGLRKYTTIIMLVFITVISDDLSSCTSCTQFEEELERVIIQSSQYEDEEVRHSTDKRSRKRSRRHSKERNRRKKRIRNERYIIVFYAWGSGQQLDTRKSTFGHAFVDIPTIGPVGYSGQVTNHTDRVKYAKYRCAIPITEEQLQNVIEKYYEWKNNPPDYDLMFTDCTTFVLDIADAAGINYGPRYIIQSPAGFMKALLKYNP